ncbi:MAG: hypothetical protein ACD_16C00018G0010 [uncultured bacterium]|nr:MAG: hypothetical protein ACD_16C00018G0010 [uncultured bacterium]
MPYKIRKFLCYTIILALLNVSFQPIYASPPPDPLDSVEDLSHSQPLPPPPNQEDEEPQTTALTLEKASQLDEQDVTESFVSKFIWTPLKVIKDAAYRGIRYAVRHPFKTLTMLLALQTRCVLGGNEFQVNRNALTSLPNPSATFFPDGNVLAVWDGASDGFGRVWNPFENPMTDDFPFGATSGLVYFPIPLSTSRNTAFVTYVGSGGNIGREFNRSGFPLTPIRQISSSSGSGVYPDATAHPNGKFYVAWPAGNPPTIFGRVVNESGIPFIPDAVQLSPPGLDSGYPSLTASPNGEVLGTWYGFRGGNSYVFGRLFDDMLNPLLNETLLSMGGDSPSAASFPNNEKVIVWTKTISGGYAIQGRVYNNSLSPLTGEMRLSEELIDTYFGGHPRVVLVPNSNGTLFVVWVSDKIGGRHIHGRLFNNRLQPLTKEGLINEVTTGEQRELFMTSSPDGTIFAIWTDEQPGNVYNVKGRFLNTTELASLPSAWSTSTSSTSLIPSSALSSSRSTTGIFTTSKHSPETSSEKINVWKGLGIGAGVVICLCVTAGGGICLCVPAGTLGIKKGCFSKKDKHSDLERSPNSIPLNAIPSIQIPPPLEPLRTSHSSLPSFRPTSRGFTEHPTFIGGIAENTYAIWKTLSPEEARRLQPFTGKTIPSASGNVIFTLGKGNFGATYAGSNIKTADLYAIKEVFGRNAVAESLNEGEISYQLRGSPHVMSLIDYKHFEPMGLHEEPRLFQVMPLAYTSGVGYRTLLLSLTSDQRENQISDTMYQLMEGLGYIHDQGFCHLDIKDENILYMRDGRLCIADFGRAQKLEKEDRISKPQFLGDTRKFAPEIIAFLRSYGKTDGDGGKVSSFSGKAADTWAGGLYILELLNDTETLFSYPRLSIEVRVSEWTHDFFEREVKTSLTSLQSRFSSALLSLLRQVLAIDPQKRMTPVQAVHSLKAFTPEERQVWFNHLISHKKQSLKEEEDIISLYHNTSSISQPVSSNSDYLFTPDFVSSSTPMPPPYPFTPNTSGH